MESTLHELKSEKTLISKALEECKSTILHLQDDLDDAQVMLFDLIILLHNIRTFHVGYDFGINGAIGSKF